MKKLKIIVAEDNTAIQMEIVSMLRQLGHTVFSVKSGGEVLSLLEKNGPSFDLLLVDCELPKLDGFELTRQIRAHRDSDFHALPVFGLSADTKKKSQELCMEAGMNDYFTKPFTMEQLARHLEGFISQHFLEEKAA